MTDGIADLWNRVRLAREGSAVERCHAFPHLMRYSVGHHTLDVIMIIILCWKRDHGGLPSSALLARAAVHDLAERVTGDLPSPVKDLLGGDALAVVESRVEEHLVGTILPLSHKEAEYLRWADRLELYLWAMEEVHGRGNRSFQTWLEGCRSELMENAPGSLRLLAALCHHHVPGAHYFLSWAHVKEVSGL